jgi:chaperonin cofactor prefoldin
VIFNLDFNQKEIYENKIKLLNSKINSDEDNLKDLKQEIRLKNEVRYIIHNI